MACLLCNSAAQGQGITVDGRLSPAQTLAGPNYAIGANLGRQVGGNLFHSFGAFGLTKSETATFTGPAGVNNVIGRVTGGAASSIDGTIRSTIQGANVYLINPAGVVFGPNARVDVTGSFHASSADYIRMSDGARFQATNPDASTLSAAPPAAFGFLSATPRPVAVNQSTLGPVPGTLGLVGGPVTISGGVLRAPSGTVHVASAAGMGEVPVNPRAGPVTTVSASGPVRLERGARIAVSDPSGGDGGSVFIHAGALSIAASEIDADNHGAGAGGILALRGDGGVAITDGAFVHALATGSGKGAAISIGAAPGGAVLVDAATVQVGSTALGDAGGVSIAAGIVALRNGAVVISTTQDRGAGGPIGIRADNTLLDGAGTFLTSINGGADPAGAGGQITLSGATLAVTNGAKIVAGTLTGGRGGAITIGMTGSVLVSGTSSDPAASTVSVISTTAGGTGRGGTITLNGGTLTIAGESGIVTGSQDRAVAGSIRVAAPAISLRDHGSIASLGTVADASVPGAETGTSGDVTVVAAATLSLDGGDDSRTGSQIASTNYSDRPGGAVTIRAGDLALGGTSVIGSNTFGPGHAGSVNVAVDGALRIERPADLPQSAFEPGINALTRSTGGAGNVTVSAHDITIRNGLISADTFNAGAAGTVSVTASGALAISGVVGSDWLAGISAQANDRRASGGTLSTGRAGDVRVRAGSVLVTDQGRISSTTFGLGDAGNVTVEAGRIDLRDTGVIRSATFSPGDARGGHVFVSASGPITIADSTGLNTVTGISAQSGADLPGSAGGNITVRADSLSMARNGEITAHTSGPGDAGNVTVTVRDGLTLDGAGSAFLTGITSQAEEGATGNAGHVAVQAGSLTIRDRDAAITSHTRGSGAAGSVTVSVAGDVLIDGRGNTDAGTGIFARTFAAEGGDAGRTTVSAANVTLRDGGAISSSTYGGGGAGGVDVTASGTLSMTATGSPDIRAGVFSNSNWNNPRGGHAGSVVVHAGTLAIGPGGAIGSQTFGGGAGGDIAVSVAGATTIDAAGGALPTGILANAAADATGSAGRIALHSGTVTLSRGAQIASTTAGAGAGGAVQVTAAGALLLDGQGAAGTQIAASATGDHAAPAGTVVVSAGTVTVQGGAQIASTTAGSGPGGDVGVGAVSDIQLNGPGPQIVARSTGSGDAGAIIVSATRLSLNDGAGISTEARTANGGNIAIGVQDMLYLRRSTIATSVDGALGNGGNILIDPRFVILDRSLIQANAVGGNGGNITIRADQLVQSADSAITATSTRAVSGEITISGPQLDLNGSLAVLASTLRSAAIILRESCATRGATPRSSLVVAGRGGRRQDAETTVPALYIADRPVHGGRDETPRAPASRQTSITLSARCG